MLDIFKNNAFSLISLTDVVNKLTYVPSRLSSMGLFSISGVTTPSIAIERVGGRLQLVKPAPRGSSGETKENPKRSISSLVIPHFPREWSVSADEVSGVRALGQEEALKTVQGVVMEKLADHLQDFAATEEHARLGAVTGVVTYADGTKTDLYKEFDVNKNDPIDFKVKTYKDGELREKCSQIIRAVRDKLGGTHFDYVHAFVGDDFFDALLKNQEVRESYKGWTDAQILRDSYVGSNRAGNEIFKFGGILWENYAPISNNGIGVAGMEAHLFPVGVPNLFRTYYAPANYNETVNTKGKRLYAKQKVADYDKGVEGEIQMNALQICMQPDVLFFARVS